MGYIEGMMEGKTTRQNKAKERNKSNPYFTYVHVCAERGRERRQRGDCLFAFCCRDLLCSSFLFLVPLLTVHSAHFPSDSLPSASYLPPSRNRF